MSEPSRQIRIAEAFRLFVDIALFRKGPEDLPVSTTLLGATIVAGILITALLLGVQPLPFEGHPALIVGVGILDTLLFTAVLLAIARHSERFLQTATALFGSQLVMTPALVATAWLLMATTQDGSWQLPAMMVRLVVEVWALAVAARILKSATEWPMSACIALAIAGELLSFLLLTSLFPQAPTTPAQA